jgi:uroporphyrinogen-III synthase
MEPLQGLSILVPESRELDMFAAMLEAEGATAVRCPLVQIRDLQDMAAAEAWIEQAIAGVFQDIIWLTGEGLRRLLPIAQQMQRQEAFIAALGRARNITRGPKPASALRALGVAPGMAARTPTSQGVLDSLAEEDLQGRSIGLQMYPGDGAMPLLAKLTARGARTWPVTPYCYASETETGAVATIIRRLADGAIGLVVFTATPQVERLLQVAKESHLDAELAAGLARTPIAAIGPVVEDTLRLHGLTATLRPKSSFHLKPLVRAITAWRQA